MKEVKEYLIWSFHYRAELPGGDFVPRIDRQGAERSSKVYR